LQRWRRLLLRSGIEAEHGEGDFAQQREIARGGRFAHPASVFPEDHVEHPVHRLDAPRPSTPPFDPRTVLPSSAMMSFTTPTRPPIHSRKHDPEKPGFSPQRRKDRKGSQRKSKRYANSSYLSSLPAG